MEEYWFLPFQGLLFPLPVEFTKTVTAGYTAKVTTNVIHTENPYTQIWEQ